MTESEPKSPGIAAEHNVADRSGETARRLAARIGLELDNRMAVPLMPGLYLVATPIGNLADVTLRALIVLAQADEVCCEDTRQSIKLLARYGLERRLSTYHEHNAERERPRLLSSLSQGHSIALISDAGTPLVSDPGFKLVRAAVEAGHAVTVIPGPSACLAALTVSGLPTDSFHFAGFLPPKSAARRARIADLAGVHGTIVLYESPARLGATLGDLAAGLGDRQAAVARELTKLNEEARRGTLHELAEWASTSHVKGEIAIVIGQRARREISDADIGAALAAIPPGAGLKDTTRDVALRLGVARSRVYDLALKLKGDTATDGGEEAGNDDE